MFAAAHTGSTPLGRRATRRGSAGRSAPRTSLSLGITLDDIKNDKTNHMSAGFTDQERGKMTELLDAGFADSFRVLHPDEVKYSWWSYRFHAREKNAGWRIDYFIVSRRIADRIRAAEIHNEIFGSDHCPVELQIDL